MLSKINPIRIVRAHWRASTDDRTGALSPAEISFHLLVPVVVAATYVWLGAGISENVVGIIVSAASIAAGLLLNLLVLIYTLVHNARSAPSLIANFDVFRQVCDEALATIAYCILLSIFLVLTAFFSLSGRAQIAAIAQFLTLYLGTSTVLCILIVLKRVYALVHFELRRA